ncbi:MAG: gluconeogenesis factor YvcK family protein [Minisyncoccia bacterium]
MKKIVVIGGGTGVFTVLNGLKDYPFELSAIVTMADDGGSSGILREEFGVLPPGDIRRALVALSSSSPFLAKLFRYRFKTGTGLKGHSFGNLFLTALEEITGDFNKAIQEAGKILGIKGQVIPVSLESTRLFARLEDDFLVIGETNIDKPKHNGNLSIKEIFLNPQVKANKEAIKSIKKADFILIGPGDLYTSIIPNFLVKGIKEAVASSKAKKIYICNIMTKYGETNHFAAEKFLSVLEKYLGKGVIDYFLINKEKPKKSYLEKYKKEGAELVKYDKKYLLSLKKPKVIFASLVRNSPLLRHDSKKLAKVIDKLTNN